MYNIFRASIKNPAFQVGKAPLNNTVSLAEDQSEAISSPSKTPKIKKKGYGTNGLDLDLLREELFRRINFVRIPRPMWGLELDFKNDCLSTDSKKSESPLKTSRCNVGS